MEINQQSTHDRRLGQDESVRVRTLADPDPGLLYIVKYLLYNHVSISAVLLMVESSEKRLCKNSLLGRILSLRPPPISAMELG